MIKTLMLIATSLILTHTSKAQNSSTASSVDANEKQSNRMNNNQFWKRPTDVSTTYKSVTQDQLSLEQNQRIIKRIDNSIDNAKQLQTQPIKPNKPSSSVYE